MGILKLLAGVATGAGKKVRRGRGASVLGHRVKRIDNTDAKTDDYKGKVLMIVNVASKCGFTPQYEQLEALHEKYKDKGFAVLGFPANDFMGQEPGSNEQIREFCSTKFNVAFDLFSKITVTGDAAPPLYRDLTSKEKNGALGGEIVWNFTKFVVGRDGRVAARAEPAVRPDDSRVVEVIEEELAKGA